MEGSLFVLLKTKNTHSFKSQFISNFYSEGSQSCLQTALQGAANTWEGLWHGNNYIFFEIFSEENISKVASRPLKAGERILAEPPVLVKSFRQEFIERGKVAHI